MFKKGRDGGTRGKRGKSTEGRGKRRREWRGGGRANFRGYHASLLKETVGLTVLSFNCFI